MEIKNRSTLKSFFENGKLPFEEHFASLIDASLNQPEDGLKKSASTPLDLAAATDENETQIRFYKDFGTDHLWQISQNPLRLPTAPDGDRVRGLSIEDGKGNSRLFIEEGSGRVGIGTVEPQAALEVKGTLRATEINARESYFSPALWRRVFRKFSDSRATALSADGNTFLIVELSHAVEIYRRINGVWNVEFFQHVETREVDIGTACSLSADGNTALISGFEGRNRYAVAIQRQENGTWGKVVDINPGVEEGIEAIRLSLSANGKTALILSLRFDSGPNGKQLESKSVIVHDSQENGNAWSRVTLRTIGIAREVVDGIILDDIDIDPGILPLDGLLSANGNTVLVANIGASQAVVSDRDKEAIWTNETILHSEIPFFDPFGFTILSSDGNTILLGDGNSRDIILSRKEDGTWAKAAFPRPRPEGLVRLSSAAALSADGNTALIGGNDVDIAYVFRRQKNGEWIHEATLQGDFGPVRSISLSAAGDSALVYSNGSDPVFIYSRHENGTWLKKSPLNFFDFRNRGLTLLLTMSADGNTVLIGEEETGNAYLFTTNIISHLMKEVGLEEAPPRNQPD